MSECKCSMRVKLVGDGCEVCNPELAEELARDLADLDEYREAEKLIALPEFVVVEKSSKEAKRIQ